MYVCVYIYRGTNQIGTKMWLYHNGRAFLAASIKCATSSGPIRHIPTTPRSGDIPSAACELDHRRGCLGGGDGDLCDCRGGGGHRDCVLAGVTVVMATRNDGLLLRLVSIFDETPFLLERRFLDLVRVGIGGLEPEEASEPFRGSAHLCLWFSDDNG